MRSLDELLHPITPEDFKANYEGRKPLHIPAGATADKRAVLPWATFNGLLAQSAIWTPLTLRVIRNGETIHPDLYCVTLPGHVTPRPRAARVQALMAEGASVVANDVHTLTPELHHLAAVLGRAFAATIGANVYCSFGGVQAFDSHYDTHDVFAIQTEGEKTWRLYANRADNPIFFQQEPAAARKMMVEQRGPLMQEVRMRPGDVLYLPRGWYHDALATEGASLHVTYSVLPLYGGILFRLLEPAALQDPAFRAWLAPAWQDDGATLAKQLA
ncbi:MAG TPA: cupin domain-containing protein, partial [Brevundimonas sp.]|nr:cupin domain-containing protein [Brevundimonas sp.]